MVTFLGMVTVLGMAMSNIISMMTNDHSRDGGHPWGRLEDLDHFGRVTFQGMVTILIIVTIIGVVTILEIAAVLGIFTILRDSYLILGPLSLRFPPKIILSKV